MTDEGHLSNWTGNFENGTLVLQRGMQPLHQTFGNSRIKFKPLKFALFSVLFVLFCWNNPSIIVLAILAGFIAIVLYELIPDKIWHVLFALKRKRRKHKHHKLPFEEDETLLSEVSVGNVFFHVRKVKVTESEPALFQVIVTYRSHRWHSWRAFADFERAQEQLRKDFPRLPVMALTVLLKDRTGDSSSPEELLEKQVSDVTSGELYHRDERALLFQGIVIVEWLSSVMDVHIICNHIEVRKLLSLPKYHYSNRYGSHHEPPHLRKSANITTRAANAHNIVFHSLDASSPTPTKTPQSPPRSPGSESSNISSSINKDVSHLSPTISSLTHGMGFLSAHTRGTPAKTISANRTDVIASPTLVPKKRLQSKNLAREELLSNSPPGKYPIKGSNWLDVEFTDQTDAEKNMYKNLQDNHNFLVRGKTYASDHKKVNTGPAICRLVIMELYEVEDGSRHDHVASMGLAKERVDAINSIAEPPELFIINFQIPGDPPISIMSIFAAPPDIRSVCESDNSDTRIYKDMWRRYMDVPRSNSERLASLGLSEKPHEMNDMDSSLGQSGGLSASAGGGMYGWKLPSDITWGDPHEPGVYPVTDFKNMRFKLIPTVTEGNWVVRSAVPSAKPAILGQKLQQRYFRGDNYVETDVDVGSSVIASQIVGVIRGYAKNFTCDVGIVLQGESEDELPEKMLACVVIDKVDVNLRRHLLRKNNLEDFGAVQAPPPVNKMEAIMRIHGEKLDE